MTVQHKSGDSILPARAVPGSPERSASEWTAGGELQYVSNARSRREDPPPRAPFRSDPQAPLRRGLPARRPAAAARSPAPDALLKRWLKSAVPHRLRANGVNPGSSRWIRAATAVRSRSRTSVGRRTPASPYETSARGSLAAPEASTLPPPGWPGVASPSALLRRNDERGRTVRSRECRPVPTARTWAQKAQIVEDGFCRQ